MSATEHGAPRDVADLANQSVRALQDDSGPEFRGCRTCRQVFMVNPRHRDDHECCSAKCRARWSREHARVRNLTPYPKERPTSIKLALLNALRDGRWWTKLELSVVVQSEPHSVSARLSELDRQGERRGEWRIQSDLRDGNNKRAHRYRLVTP